MPVSKYQSNADTVHPIRLATATLAAAGNPPAGAVTSPIYAKVSKSNREFGIRPRMVILARPLAPGPDDKIRYKRLPVLTEAAFDSAAFSLGSNVSVGATQWKIISRLSEDY